MTEAKTEEEDCEIPMLFLLSKDGISLSPPLFRTKKFQNSLSGLVLRLRRPRADP